MSDSDNDLLPSNAYTFQNHSTTISAKGPHVNNTNITGINFRNNVLTSTMNMSRNFERQRHREYNFDQRSMPYRREASPMSMYSDIGQINLHNSFYPGGMSSQRSMYNGRSGSPMSMRSMGSNASVFATSIASAIEAGEFNNHDFRIITEAYNKVAKRRVKRRVQKQRKMIEFMKNYRKNSSYDSGEQGCDSSTSSDDHRSTRSAMYRHNFSSSQSTRTNIIDLRQSIRESNLYKDSTNGLQNSAFKNIFSVPPNCVNPNASNIHHRFNESTLRQNPPSFNQKERFRNGFVLPSQRFNQSIASVPILEDPRTQTKQTSWNCKSIVNIPNQRNNGSNKSESEEEEIFSDITVREKSCHNPESHQRTIGQNKRKLELDEDECSDKKRTKLSTPQKQNKTKIVTNTKRKNVLKKDNNNKGTNNAKVGGDFEFLKPQLPVRKSGSSRFKEQLISKSAAPLCDALLPAQNVISSKGIKNQVQMETPILSPKNHINSDKTIDEQSDTMPHSYSDMSLRPSFIKRKLFSQKMDVTENKNLSTDEAININSPQTNVYSAIQRERHKTRKVVTNQSCLNRDIAQDDSNLLDLIHKIVPADRINVTNTTNKTNISKKPSQEEFKNNDDDKWDVTSVISMCNNDNASDTYTDEEIFDNNKNKTKKDLKKKPIIDMNMSKNCKVVLEKSVEISKLAKPNDQIIKPLTPKNIVDNSKNNIYCNVVKSFWDTDFESDLESPGPKRWAEMKENHNKSILQQHNKDKPQQNNTNNLVLQSTGILSDGIKSNTNNSILDKNMGKLKKYNINRNLTIKAFRTPKIKLDKKEDNYADETPPAESKDPKMNKIKQQCVVLKAKHKKTEEKKTIVDEAKKQLQTKTQPSNSEPKNSETNSRSAAQNENITDPKIAKPQHNLRKTKTSDNLLNSNASLVPATRPNRVPNKKCGHDDSEVEGKTKAKQNKGTKLNSKSSSESSNMGKNYQNNIELVKQPGKNYKNFENIVNPCNNELFCRTLRTRVLDLSSSQNSSYENSTNITIKSLRTRKINLSSSINDSTLGGNLFVAKKVKKTPLKKSNRSVTKRGVKSVTKRGIKKCLC